MSERATPVTLSIRSIREEPGRAPQQTMAPRWRRTAAFALDLGIWCGAWAVICWWTAFPAGWLGGAGYRGLEILFGLPTPPYAVLLGWAAAWLLAMVALVGYGCFVVAHVKFGRYPGMWLLGLRIAPGSSTTMSWRLAWTRFFWLVVGLIPAAGGLMLGLGPRRLALHDRTTGTRVERGSRRRVRARTD